MTRLDTFARVMSESREFGASGHCLVVMLMFCFLKVLLYLGYRTFGNKDLNRGRKRVRRLAGVISGVARTGTGYGQGRLHFRTRLHRDPESRIPAGTLRIVVDHTLLQIPKKVSEKNKHILSFTKHVMIQFWI